MNAVSDLCIALENELAAVEQDIRWAETADLGRLIERRERMTAALAKARQEQSA